MELNIRKTNNLVKKWVEVLNRHFTKEDTQMAQRHMKRCSTSLIITERQAKTTIIRERQAKTTIIRERQVKMRYQVMSVRMAIIKKSRKNKCWKSCGEKKREPSCTVGRNVN